MTTLALDPQEMRATVSAWHIALGDARRNLERDRRRGWIPANGKPNIHETRINALTALIDKHDKKETW